MNIAHYTIALIIALALLIPLGLKWCLKMKIVLASAIIIGLLSGLLTRMLLIVMPSRNLFLVIVLQIASTLVLAVIGLLFMFYRDPERTPPDEEGIIVSPADGTIIYIKEISAAETLHSNKKGTELPVSEDVRKKYFPGTVHVVGIAMNFLDVHVNRIPIGGRIELYQRVQGKFLSLRKKEAYFLNERALTVIDCGPLNVGVIQIASRLVRRITATIAMNDGVRIGQRMGAITFGSQVDLIIPVMESLKLEAGIGQEVKAGTSVIARQAISTRTS